MYKWRPWPRVKYSTCPDFLGIQSGCHHQKRKERNKKGLWIIGIYVLRVSVNAMPRTGNQPITCSSGEISSGHAETPLP